jgi:predicted RND superfamily exporter protein
MAKGVSKTEAVKTTIETTGWSLVGAATTTIVALLATFAAAIPSVQQFSIVVITLIGFSFVASLCILPTLLTSRFVK